MHRQHTAAAAPLPPLHRAAQEDDEVEEGDEDEAVQRAASSENAGLRETLRSASSESGPVSLDGVALARTYDVRAGGSASTQQRGGRFSGGGGGAPLRRGSRFSGEKLLGPSAAANDDASGIFSFKPTSNSRSASADSLQGGTVYLAAREDWADSRAASTGDAPDKGDSFEASPQPLKPAAPHAPLPRAAEPAAAEASAVPSSEAVRAVPEAAPAAAPAPVVVKSVARCVNYSDVLILTLARCFLRLFFLFVSLRFLFLARTHSLSLTLSLSQSVFQVPSVRCGASVRGVSDRGPRRRLRRVPGVPRRRVELTGQHHHRRRLRVPPVLYCFPRPGLRVATL